MQEEFQKREIERGRQVRSIIDYSRGVVFTLLGLFFIFFEQFKIETIQFYPWYRYLGGLFVIYGAWRIYRGYKKNYYR